MKAAACRLINETLENDPSNIEFCEDGSMIASVAVTVDGTWQRRGHCSKYVILFVISVLTGGVLDFEVKSLFCYSCAQHKNDSHASKSYLDWYEMHIDFCSINHVDSSGSMGTEGATMVFMRSILKRNLKYLQLVDDGDSGCFGTVAAKCKEKYGDSYIVTKEECVGHVQKRIGSALRADKRKSKGKQLSDNKGVGGHHRLTDAMIDRIQNYYGQAIRNNSGNLPGMKSISAIFKHVIINDNETIDDHRLALIVQKMKIPGVGFGKINKGSETYNESNRLPYAFKTELEPIFNRLSNETLLERCLAGHTQNQNESLNGVLWSNCSKNKFCK